MILGNLEPSRVFNYFEQISAIPRGSGNTEKIKKYLLGFADEHGLESLSDEAGNVLIRKPAFRGYEKAEGVIIQGHMDMVCISRPDKIVDFENEGIVVCTDGEKIWADGTSLGADNGIAIAYTLAILESDSIPHPAIEALFTTDEETGLLGASAFDVSLLSGKKLINIDSEIEGYLTVGCAGGLRCTAEIKAETENSSGEAMKITIKGLSGGHSGMEIDKCKENSIKLLGRILFHLSDRFELNIASIHGGLRENAIPSEAEAEIYVDKLYADRFLSEFHRYTEELKKELKVTEPNLSVLLTGCKPRPMMFTRTFTEKFIFLLYHCPNGIIRMNPIISGNVQTSLNLGILSQNDDTLSMRFSLRSSVAAEKEEIKERLKSFMEYLGAKAEFTAEYPAWEYRKDSVLRDTTIEAYKKVYRESPQIMTLHAGLECGVFAGKNPELDCISFGPDLKDVHSPDECMTVSSVSRTWRFLLEILKLST